MIAQLFTDGGIIGPNPSLLGGTWAWCHVNERGERIHHESGIVRPFLKGQDCQPLPVTNNNTEMIALTRGLLSLPAGWTGRVCSDSRLALGWIFWNFKHTLVPPCLYAKAMEAKARLGRIEAVLLDGHPTAAQIAAGRGKRGGPVSVHNQFCDTLCCQRSAEFRKATL